jgi:pyrimidine-nucleoside phosphorylase
MQMTDMVSILEKKKNGLRLTQEEIAHWVHGVREGRVPDYQSSALLMAIRLRGMDAQETADLTLEMARTGDMADLSAIPGVKVDKHSTGGVGDLTTLVAVPLAAACGVPVAKMSGRALGHTGGTLDKLWSIPGLSTDLSMAQFIRQVKDVGCAVIGQSGELAPVDKVLYALRDVTATVDSLPLIVSSILSKKIAAGCDAILLDVKTGSGALMPTLEDSVKLAKEMVRIGKTAGRRVMALVTDMDQPLGRNIGNALEVMEAAEILKGREPGRARDLCLEVAARMAMLSFGMDEKEARGKAEAALESGAGLQKLREMVAAQGGDAAALDDYARLPTAREHVALEAPRAGYLSALQAQTLGLAANALGAGRSSKEAEIDPAVGIVLHKRVGDRINCGDTIATLHVNSRAHLEEALELARQAVTIAPQPPEARPLIFEIIE